MQLNTKTLLLLTTTTTILPILAHPNPNPNPIPQDLTQCGLTNGPCNQNGCQGVNNPDTGLGTCTAGHFKGCPCASVCGVGEVGPCAGNGCNGVLKDGLGFCTAGDYNGCPCDF